MLDSDLNFAKDKREWNDTDIVFDISQKDGETEVRFTHAGLVPRFECYGSCSNAWGTLINGNLQADHDRQESAERVRIGARMPAAATESTMLLQHEPAPLRNQP